MRRPVYHPMDRFFYRAFDGWRLALPAPNPLRKSLTEEEWRVKRRRHGVLLSSAFQSLQVPLESAQDWDTAVWPTVEKIQKASLYYLFTGDSRAIAPAVEGLTALEACPRPYWTFSSCLGVLDMDLRTASCIHALALMKSAMGDVLNPFVKQRLKAQAVDRILRPALEAEQRKSYAWMKSRANWRIILPGCFAMAAMAFAHECPFYRELIAYGLDGMLASFSMGDAEGGWNEGPGYWNYGLSYAVLFSWHLKHFTGGAINLFQHPFLRKTGDFYLFMHIRPGRVWNWSDAGKKAGSSLALTGLARAYQNPAWQWLALALGVKNLEQLWLLDPWLKPRAPPARQPTRRFFPGLGVAVWRGGFGSKDYYVGIKGGDIPHFNHHCHMDFGSFVLWAEGRELLAELDPWPYPYEGKKKPGDRMAKPGFYDPECRRWLRWDFDCVAALGHNMVTLEGGYPQPSVGARARIRLHGDRPDLQWAVVDSTTVYRPLARKVRRFFVLLEPHVLLVVDEIRATQPIRARLHFHVRGKITWGPDGFHARNGAAQMRTRSLFPAAEDHLIMGIEERLTTYQPPGRLAKQRVRCLYLENLYRKRRLVFVMAFQFGHVANPPAAFILEGIPIKEDRFGVIVRQKDRLTRITINLVKGTVQ